MDDNFWRATIGFVTLAINRHSPGYEFAKMAPPGVGYCETRVYSPRHSEWTVDLYGSLESVIECVRILNVGQVSAIIQDGTPFAIRYGEEVREKISAESEVPVILQGDALLEGAKAMGAQKVIIGHPYPDENFIESQRRFFEDAGIEVVAMVNLAKGFDVVLQHHLIGPGTIYTSMRDLFARNGDVDALIISGGALRCVDIINELEKDTGKPVVTSMSASCWKALKVLGIRDEIRVGGRLLHSLGTA